MSDNDSPFVVKAVTRWQNCEITVRCKRTQVNYCRDAANVKEFDGREKQHGTVYRMAFKN